MGKPAAALAQRSCLHFFSLTYRPFQEQIGTNPDPPALLQSLLEGHEGQGAAAAGQITPWASDIPPFGGEIGICSHLH